jgi:hypothetical protein
MAGQTFRKPMRTTEGGPQPIVQDVRALDDLELASYLEASDYDFDGLTTPVRVAIIRLLRR